MDLDVRHLRVVNAIAEHGSISKAAAALGYTQPALTAQLQRIERTLGGALFVRDGSGARPTALGTVVVTHSLTILASHEELMRDVRRRGPDDADVTAVRLGSVPGPLTAVLMTATRALLPKADPSLHVNESEEELLELLAEGRLEFGLGIDYPGYDLPLRPDLSHAVLAVEPIFVLMPQSHPLAGQDEVPLEALADEQWLTGEGKDVRMRQQFRDACRRAGFTPRRVQRMNSAVVFPLIGQGHAVSLAHALTPERSNVVARPLAGDPMWVRQRLVWPSWSPLATHAPALRDALTDAYWALARKSPVYSAWLARHGQPLTP
ncbi:LysR family transcriptional regulator [Actinomycetes bacterium KLBMP 9797]